MMVSLSNRRLLLTAAFCNVVVIVLCFAVFGMNAEGAGAATRNTARFAICFFLAGFAAPGIRKWLPWFPQAETLIQAFVAAQMVHFCSVIALHTKFAAEPLQLGAPQIALVVLGFLIVLGAGLTAAKPRPYSYAHVLLLYLIWLILAADYSEHPVKPLRFVAVPVFLALVLRHLPRRQANEPALKATSGAG
jgi:hypothetical protein